MFSVALIGPDGAGKTTIGRRLEKTLPIPVRYLYMGVNLEASNRMLPTTRLLHGIKRACGAKPDRAGPPDPARMAARPKGRVKRGLKCAKSLLGLTHRVSEEWYRQAVSWYFQWTGRVVVYDRHYFHDFFAYDIAQGGAPRSLARRLHGLMLSRLFPHPDLVIYLDAPSEVLFARKGEGTLESLERRRHEYLAMGQMVKNFEVVDANRPADVVTADVAERIMNYYASSTGRQSERAYERVEVA